MFGFHFVSATNLACRRIRHVHLRQPSDEGSRAFVFLQIALTRKVLPQQRPRLIIRLR